jgi:hypothetical protein
MAAVRGQEAAQAHQGREAERALFASRLLLGAAYLSWSAQAARHGRGPAALRRVAAILGARHVGQALLTASRPGRAALALGTEVDAAHCASMVLIGALSGRWRAPALADALLAGSLAGAGLACARSSPQQEPAAAGTLQHWRDRCAQRIARYLAPSWLTGTE